MNLKVDVRQVNKEHIKDVIHFTFPIIKDLHKLDNCHAVIATQNNALVGLLLISIMDKKIARIISFFVTPDRRDIGVGKELFKAAENWLKNNVEKAYLRYQSNYESKDLLESILEKYNWVYRKPLMKLYYLNIYNLINSPLWKFKNLPKGYYAKSWATLESKEIKTLQSEKVKVGHSFDPFQNPQRRIDDLSFILFKNDIPIGWMISHDNSGMVERSCFYVQKNYRKPFLAQAFHYVVSQAQVEKGQTKTMVQVYTDNMEMISYYNHYIRPYIDKEVDVFNGYMSYESS